MLGEPFKMWVYQQMEERNALMTEKKEMMIAMDPEMAAKFEASTHVSRKSNLQSVSPSNGHHHPYSLQRHLSQHAEDQQ